MKACVDVGTAFNALCESTTIQDVFKMLNEDNAEIMCLPHVC